jgi:integrase
MITHLTDAVVRRLPAPAKGNRVTRDDAVTGFGARVTAAGNRAFVLTYTTKAGVERRFTIGAFPDWTVTGARARARELRQLIDQGGDPLAEVEYARAAPTVAELCDRFEQEHFPRKRPETAANYAGLLRNHIRPHFGPHMKVADVTFTDIDTLHRKVTKGGSPYTANRVTAVLSKMFSLAVRWKMRTTNPCKGIERNTEFRRKRYLTGDELVRLTAALDNHSEKQAAAIVRMLLLTGARSGEVFSMRWDNLDLKKGLWSKPASSTKQKEDHEVPLSAPALQLLTEIASAQRPRTDFVFPGVGDTGHVVEIKKSWAMLCKAAGITGLRVHDLRHSFASQLASGGATLPLIGALLGHSNPATTARYAHLFQDPQRAAVERVGAIITGKPAVEPVTLPARKRRR